MADARMRRQVAHRAAQLMYERIETEYFSAKRKAAKQLGVAWKHRPADLPSNAEIRDEILTLARMYEGEKRTERLRAMRLRALRMMRRLEKFRPRLIGSVLTGHIRSGSDIDLHVFSDGASAVQNVLDDHRLVHTVEHKRVVKFDQERVFTHIHALDGFEFELTVYSEKEFHFDFKSSITGKSIEKADIRELTELLRAECPDADLEFELSDPAEHIDPYELFRMLLLPLERVKQNAEHHPEGDALYHSLQVFENARRARPWDEEFLLAALLHDVGKAIDPGDHVGAALEALQGAVTGRTEFLIAHHMDALAYRDGTLAKKTMKILAAHEDFEDLMLLRDCDDGGRVPGAPVGTVEEALEFIRGVEGEAYLS